MAKDATSRITPPLKWHGGKWYLASRIIELMPPHIHYVEPYAGGLSVLLAKDPEGVSEVANDLNGWLTNFWNVLRDRELFPHLLRFLQATPFSQPLFETAADILNKTPLAPTGLDSVTAAAWFFVCCRQSLAGRMKSFAPLSRRRVRRGMNEQASAWLNAIEGLPEVHERLKRVVILNENAAAIIRREDGPQTLFYLDPPYVPDSRSSPDVYAFEMTLANHDELLSVAKSCAGRVMISGYDCDFYRDRLGQWTRHEFDLPNNAAGGDSKRRMTEVLWCNFESPSRAGVAA